MTSTECPVKLMEEIVVEHEIEAENQNDINTLVNDGQSKDIKNKLFSQEEKDEKRPFSSVLKGNDSEKSMKVSNRFKEGFEFDKTDQIEGQSFVVFNETECMKFAEKFHKIVEELKMNRISERENELRIENLMSEKSDLERLKDEQIMKNSELIQKHSQKHDEARKQHEEKLHSLQEDKTKHMLEKQSEEKEIKALKDEIRALHITKYTMEKLIKDQERQLQSHGTNNANYLTQLAKLEKQCKDVFKQCSHIITAVEKVEANVNASMKLNKKLTFINEHQNCVLDVYKGKLDKKTQDLIISEAKRASSSNDECHAKDTESPSLVHLENELRMQKELCHQVQVQLNDTRQENQELLKSLNNAHELLGKHVETNNKFVETDAMTQLELDELRTECEKLRGELNGQRANAEEREARIKEVKKAQEEKEKELSEYIKQLKTDFEVLKKEKVSLEQLNSTWSQKNVEQREEIEKLKETISELENSTKEAKEEMGIQSVQVKKLEGDLKNEVNWHEDLLRKAKQNTSDATSETMKLKERIAELQQNEKKVKVELEKLKSEKENRQRENQFVQTELIETKEQGTYTGTSDQLLMTTRRQTLTSDRSENDSTSARKPSDPETQKLEVPGVLERAQQGSPIENIELNNNIPGQHFTDTHCEQDLVGKNHKDITSTKNQPQCDMKNTSLPRSVSNITTFVQDKKHEKSNCVKNGCNAQTSIKKIMPGDPTFSDEVQNSTASTASSLNTTAKLKELPSVQDTSLVKSRSLETATDEGLTTRQKMPREENTFVEDKKSVSTGKDIERELKLRSRFPFKRSPLLAVVKPATRGTREENIDTSLPSNNINQSLEDNPMINTVHDLPCEVVQSLSSQRKPPTEALITAKSDHVVISDEPTANSKNIEKVHEIKPVHGLQQATTSHDEPQKSDSSVTKGQTVGPPTPTTNSKDNERNNNTRQQTSHRRPQQHTATTTKAQSSSIITEEKQQMGCAVSKNDGKVAARTTGVEEFCFSDEEEESMPKAIGMQIDRIEVFLKNDRLKLCKKRKISQE